MHRRLARRPLLPVVAFAALLTFGAAAPLFGQESAWGPEVTTDPDAAPLVVDDLVHFRETLDALAERATRAEDTVAIIQELYLDRATPGLAFWAENFRVDAASLAHDIARRPAFFSSLRDLDRRVLEQEPRIRAAFRQWVEIHPETTFPPTYFFVGEFRAGGLVREVGLLIGADLYSRGSGTPMDEFRTPGSIRGIERTPHLVSHELAHFQQVMAQGIDRYRALYGDGASLLGLTIREGSADFLAELTSGGHINPDAHAYGDLHEAELWARFSIEMHQPESGDWLFADPADEAWPRDLGYYFGHRITETFYENADDPDRAVQEILRVTDWAGFLERSGYAGGR